MKSVFFSTDQAVQLAQFLAECERQGLAYKVEELAGGWRVTITGF